MKSLRKIPYALLNGAILLTMALPSGCASTARKDAIAKAGQLGISQDELHGQYSFFLEYTDRVEKNKKLGDLSEFIIRLFPEVAEHIQDENKALFLDKLGQLQFEIGDIEFGGQYDSSSEKVLFSNKYYQWDEFDNCFILYHEMMHFVDRYIDGTEQRLAYNGRDFSVVEDSLYNGDDPLVNSYFAEEGMADLYVAKTLSKSYDSYYSACNFLTTMEYIYGSDVVEDMLFDRNTSRMFVSLLQELDYDNAKIVKIMKDFDAYTYDFWDAEPVSYSFEDVLVDMYQKKIGNDWQKDPIFCYLLYNQTLAYTQERSFSGNYIHSEIASVKEKEMEKMRTRCATINRAADVFQEEDDPEKSHAVIYIDGELWLSERTWILNEKDEYELEIHLLRYDFENETLLEHRMADLLEFPERLHKEYLEKSRIDTAETT
ncbi:MAG: hypothetical protein IKD90_06945 [Clostridiales bacterium]|nr:hypothetical protein [Clostridiales bacterium]